jgi:hypothetical protein
VTLSLGGGHYKDKGNAVGMNVACLESRKEATRQDVEDVMTEKSGPHHEGFGGHNKEFGQIRHNGWDVQSTELSGSWNDRKNCYQDPLNYSPRAISSPLFLSLSEVLLEYHCTHLYA